MRRLELKLEFLIALLIVAYMGCQMPFATNDIPNRCAEYGTEDRPVTKLPIQGEVWSLEAHGEHVYVSASDFRGSRAGFYILKEDHSGLRVSGKVGIPARPLAMTVEHDLAFIVFSDTLLVVDTRSKEAPRVIGGLALPANEAAADIDWHRGQLFIAGWNQGLIIIDVTIPTQPFIVHRLEFGVEVTGVEIAGQHVFAVDRELGLRVYDINLLPSGEPIYEMTMPGEAWDIAIGGDYAFVAAGSGGLVKLDISDPAAPTVLDQTYLPGWSVRVAISDGYAFVGEQRGYNLEILSFTETRSPELVEAIEVPGRLRSLWVDKQRVYMGGGGNSGVMVISFDKTPPSASKTIGYLDTPGTGSDIVVQGEYAYVADKGELLIVDVMHPESPEIVGSVSTPGTAFRLDVSDGYAYVVEIEYGLRVFDVSSVTDPQLVASLRLSGGQPADIALLDGCAFVPLYFTGSTGVSVVDISTPTEPFVVKTISTPGSAWSAATGRAPVLVEII